MIVPDGVARVRTEFRGGRVVVGEDYGGIIAPKRMYEQLLIVSPSTGDFHRARWCAGDYSGEVVAGKRTIGTLSFRVRE